MMKISIILLHYGLKRLNKIMQIFQPIKINSLKLKNRIGMSSMCQYSSDNNGYVKDWHRDHWKTRAIGGVGLIMSEATAIRPDGKLTENDLCLFNKRQSNKFKSAINQIHDLDAKFGIQLVHCGRKSWGKEKGKGKFKLISSSAIAFDNGWVTPNALTEYEINKITDDFAASALLAKDSGADLIEIHAAHGYLIHQFLSPLSNNREDEYGGSIENRSRILKEIIQKCRKVNGKKFPIFIRISCTDWANSKGYNLSQALVTSKIAHQAGADLIDCSSGGTLPITNPPLREGYQIGFASKIRNTIGIPTAGVGLLRNPEKIEKYISEGKIDIALLGRELLRNPYWLFSAAAYFNDKSNIPKQYIRAY